MQLLENQNCKLMEEFGLLKKQYQLNEDKSKDTLETKLIQVEKEHQKTLQNLKSDFEMNSKNSLLVCNEVDRENISENISNDLNMKSVMKQEMKGKAKKSTESRYKNQPNINSVDLENII